MYVLKLYIGNQSRVINISMFTNLLYNFMIKKYFVIFNFDLYVWRRYIILTY